LTIDILKGKEEYCGMKRILSMIMVAALAVTGTVGVCFGLDTTEESQVDVKAVVTADDNPTLSGSVPGGIGDITFDISETIYIKAKIIQTQAEVTPLTITNQTSGKTLTVTKMQATGANGWTAESSAVVANASSKDKVFNLSLDGNDLTTADGYTMNEQITGIGSHEFQFTGLIAPQTEALAASIAKLVVTLSAETTA
jgi:hypothetical protein